MTTSSIITNKAFFGLELCSQAMNISPVGWNVKCQVLIVVFVGFGCQLGYMIYISRQSTRPSCTKIRQVLVIFFLAWTWVASSYDSNEKLWSCGHSKRADRKQMTSIIISWEPVDGLGTSWMGLEERSLYRGVVESGSIESRRQGRRRGCCCTFDICISYLPVTNQSLDLRQSTFSCIIHTIQGLYTKKPFDM